MKTNHEKQRKTLNATGVSIYIFGILFLLIWCLIAASIGAWFMVLFVIPMASLLVFRLIFLLKQEKNGPWDMQDELLERAQALHSVVQDAFENDSIGENTDKSHDHSPRFCHHCHFWIHNSAQFCPKCGRWVP